MNRVLRKCTAAVRAPVPLLIGLTAALLGVAITSPLGLPAAGAGISPDTELASYARAPSGAALPALFTETPIPTGTSQPTATSTPTATPTETPILTTTPSPTATATTAASPTPTRKYVYLPLMARQWPSTQPRQCSVPPATPPAASEPQHPAGNALEDNGSHMPGGMEVAWRNFMRARVFGDHARRSGDQPVGDRGSARPAETVPAGPQAEPSVFYGQVTAKGVVTSGVHLNLHFFDGVKWSMPVTVTTDANGTYAFPPMPALGPNQQYFVAYSNKVNRSGPAFLWYWQCEPVSVYPTTDDLRCDFDLAGIKLQSPPSPALLSPPATFTWERRPATPGDTYGFSLWDPLTIIGNLGQVNSYTLSRVPDHFGPNRLYYWAPEVYNAYGGGWGYEARLVRFDRYLDDFGNLESGWITSDNETYTAEYAEGEYRILVKQKNAGGPIAHAPSGFATSYAVDVDARLTSDAPGAYGLLFGISEDSTEYYSFWVDPLGQQFIILKTRPDQPWDILFNWTTAQAIQAPRSSNHLQVIRQGSSIEVCANGVQLTRLEDASYTGWRRMGMSLSSFEQSNIEARFDNFQVRVLESGPVR